MPDQPNPYLSRGPVRSQEMFFGRDHELREIANFLKGNQSVSVVGPRKIGKTSLLFHLMRPRISEELGIAGGVQVGMILDESERLSANPRLDVNFFNALRSIAGRFQLVFLTASASPLIALTYSGRSQASLSWPFV